MFRALAIVGLLAGAAGAGESDWVSLFDGKSLAGWTSPSGGKPGKGWKIEDGALHRESSGGDLLSEKQFTDFELEFDWKVAKGTNSGVKYRVLKTPGGWLGPEYQVLDDLWHPNGKVADTSAASLYEIAAPSADKKLKPIGEWNHSKVVAKGTILEHWINGKRVLKIDIGGPEWPRLKKESKFSKVEGFGGPKAGHILLQDHGDEVWFRSIRIRGL